MFPTFALCLALISQAQIGLSTPAPALSHQAPTGVAIQARVVDDETGNPIESFNVESGQADAKNPAAIVWGQMTWSIPNAFTIVNGKSIPLKNPEGKFDTGLGVDELGSRKREWLRVVADGYEPMLIIDRPLGPSDAGKRIEALVSLKRGKPLIGRVLDHTGKPAAGAKLFLIRPSRNTIRMIDDVIGAGHDKGLLDPGVTRAVADAQGRFRLTGIGDAKAIGVSAASIHFWRVDLPLAGDEPTIRLPKPATLRISYAIDGDEAEAVFQLYLRQPEAPHILLSVQRNIRVPNRKEAIVSDLTPGEYTLWRTKVLTQGDYHRNVAVEMRRIAVGNDRELVADFTRERGAPVVGKVSGPAGDQARMIFVGIEPVADAPGNALGFRRQLLEIAACGEDGRFQTARIPPGEYVVRAVGYRGFPRFGPFASMEICDFTGSASVFVPLDGIPREVQLTLVDPSKETGRAR
jgi:hypothetical protein